jgi:hypothetical protein
MCVNHRALRGSAQKHEQIPDLGYFTAYRSPSTTGLRQNACIVA